MVAVSRFDFSFGEHLIVGLGTSFKVVQGLRPILVAQIDVGPNRSSHLSEFHLLLNQDGLKLLGGVDATETKIFVLFNGVSKVPHREGSDTCLTSRVGSVLSSLADGGAGASKDSLGSFLLHDVAAPQLFQHGDHRGGGYGRVEEGLLNDLGPLQSEAVPLRGDATRVGLLGLAFGLACQFFDLFWRRPEFNLLEGRIRGPSQVAVESGVQLRHIGRLPLLVTGEVVVDGLEKGLLRLSIHLLLPLLLDLLGGVEETVRDVGAEEVRERVHDRPAIFLRIGDVRLVPPFEGGGDALLDLADVGHELAKLRGHLSDHRIRTGCPHKRGRVSHDQAVLLGGQRIGLLLERIPLDGGTRLGLSGGDVGLHRGDLLRVVLDAVIRLSRVGGGRCLADAVGDLEGPIDFAEGPARELLPTDKMSSVEVATLVRLPSRRSRRSRGGRFGRGFGGGGERLIRVGAHFTEPVKRRTGLAELRIEWPPRGLADGHPFPHGAHPPRTHSDRVPLLLASASVGWRVQNVIGLTLRHVVAPCNLSTSRCSRSLQIWRHGPAIGTAAASGTVRRTSPVLASDAP